MKDYLEFVELIPVFKPVVASLIESLSEYEDEYNKIRTFAVKQIVENKSAIYQGFIDKGIPAEHALALTINSTQQLTQNWKDGIKNSSNKSKGV